MQKKKFWIAALLLVLLIFLIPIDHKYDKPLRIFSKTLIPQGLFISPEYNKKIFFYISDIISLFLFFFALVWVKIPPRQFFKNPLWIVFLTGFFSILVSPFSNYPVAYTRLLQLLTPIVLFSFLATAFNSDQRRKITELILWTFVFAGVMQAAIAITQYFHQNMLGLHLFGEPKYATCNFYMENGKRWIFDSIIPNTTILRSCGTMPHPNVLGGFLALSVIASYPLFLSSKSRPLLALALPLQIFALATTYSRSALFGWVIATMTWFLIMLFKRGSYKQPIYNTLALILFLSVTATSFLLHEQYLARGGIINYSNSLAQKSDQGRVLYHDIALRIIKKNPILGLGFNQFSERAAPYIHSGADPKTAPHNIYLFLACETGLISLFSFVAFIGILLWKTAREKIQPQTATLTSIFILFLFIGCCDFYPLLYQQGTLMFFIPAGLLAAHVLVRSELTLVHRIKNPDRTEVWKMFDQISPTYDRINRILSLKMDQRWRKKLASHLPKADMIKILDLATGTGDQAIALLQSGSPIHSITGIDLSQEMLKIAKSKLGSQVELIVADAEDLPFTNESFDAATFSFGIRNVTNPLTSLKEIHRILKPQGRCLILEFSLPPQPIKSFYLFYLRHLLPRIGGLLSKNKAAYRYLNKTIENFPSGKHFSSLMKQAGFYHLKRVPMALGGVTLYIGDKA